MSMQEDFRGSNHFDRHRKDHEGRPMLFAAAIGATLLLWIVIVKLATLLV